MKNNIQLMTEATLIERSRLRPWERRMESVGCISGLLLSVCAAAGTLLRLGWAYLIAAIMAFFAVGIAGAIFVSWATHLRAMPYQNELRRRHRLPELPGSSAEAEPLFAADTSNTSGKSEPPDAVLLLKGHGLPHGKTHFARVNLWQGETPRGTLLAQTLSRFDFDRDMPFTAEHGEAVLTAEECAGFWALLPEVETSSTDKLQDFVMDGFPCRLVVLRREPFQRIEASCNLAGIREADAAHPVPAMMQALLTASRKAVAAPDVRTVAKSSSPQL